jgi:co-chaperonin GroES (HSP10)
MASYTSAGSTIEVSATLPATYDSTGYAALTYTAIGEVTSIGSFGQSANLVTHLPLDSRVIVKRKGSYNYGTLGLEMARDDADAGQVILVAAQSDDNSHSFKITLQDGTVLYFTGQVMGYQTSLQGTDSITMASCAIEIDQPIVTV